MAEPERKIVLKLKCYTSSPRQRAAAYKFILDENDRSLKHECEFYELVAVRQGDGDFHYGGKVMPVVRNEVYLIPPHVPHYYSGYTHLSMLHFIFMPEVLEPYLERFEQERSFLRLSSPPEKGTALIVSDDLMLELDRMNICICREAIDKSEGWLLRQEFQTLQALSLICSGSELKSRKEQQLGPGLYAAILYIENNYASPISLQKLARCANMSVPGFCRMFKKSCNTSPIRYLLEYRIAMAKQLLISTQLTLTEVAEKTGFRDTNYFIKQFGAIAGISPMKFRNQEHGLLHYPDHTPETLPEVGSRIFVN